MASNAAKQTKLPIGGARSQTLTDGENAPKKDFWSCKTTNANGSPSKAALSSIRKDLMWLGIYFGIYFVIGTGSFYAVKDDLRGKKTNDFIDAVYMCVQTMTTVGYGDLVPHDFFTQLVCCVFIIIGMCLFGIVIKLAAKYLVVKQQMVLLNALHLTQKLGPTEALRELDALKIDYIKCVISLIVMVLHFVAGVSVLVSAEKMEFNDAVYGALTTMTTVGFGDETFSSESGRTFAVFWITTGTSCLGQLFLYIAEVYTDIQTKKLVKWVVTTNIFANTDLEAADHVEDDKPYGAADFILYNLKEMGKIKQEDISAAMKDIDYVTKGLDVDDHKVIHVSQAQSSENK